MELLELINDPESTRSQSVYARMLQMKKLDIVELRNLYDRACEMCEQEQKQEDGFLALLSAPARRALEGEGITTLAQLATYSEKELLKLHGLGPSAIPKLRSALESAGLNFNRE